jgi:phage-related protein
MPKTEVVFYAEAGVAPVLQWLTELRHTQEKAYAQCVVRLEQLAACGHELRRPAADYLRDGLYELRAKKGRIQYRILYFFHGRNVVVLAHAFVKEEAAVPDIDIDRAVRRKKAFVGDPSNHMLEKEIDDEQEENRN